MFPGMGGPGGRGLNPKKLNSMMKQLGIEVEDIDDVQEVIIRTADREIVFKDAAVSKMVAQGQTTWQLTGTPEERQLGPVYTEDDVKLVMEGASVSEEAARKALDDADGQPADAIMKLAGDE